MTDISQSAYYAAISGDGVTSQQRQTDFQIQPEVNKEGKKTILQTGTVLMACTWKWKVTGTGRQEGGRGTKGHRQEVVKGHFLPNPDYKSKQSYNTR